MNTLLSRKLSTLTTSLLVLIASLSAGALFGCQKGPAQETGEKIDKAIDKLSGKGPAEKAGERVDQAVNDLKK